MIPFAPPRPALALALACAAGCGTLGSLPWGYDPYPESPFRSLERVAVAPFLLQRVEDPVAREKARAFAQVFASELAKFRGLRVVRPDTVQARMHREGVVLDSAASALRLARLLQVDAILVGEVTDFRDYLPKRVGLAVQLYPVKAFWRGAAGDPRVLERHGKPFGYEEDPGGATPIIEIERVVDAHFGEVREETQRFGGVHDPERPLDDLGQEAYTHVTELYLQFVSNRLIREVFEVERLRQRAESRARSSRGKP
ncbi:MAG: hypothetical protein HY722_14165 [Planctomycetes bacterium]|nr:hypothetical protein [Planctomycetota bacterium]